MKQKLIVSQCVGCIITLQLQTNHKSDTIETSHLIVAVCGYHENIAKNQCLTDTRRAFL